jgi:PRC-barrel domain protein
MRPRQLPSVAAMAKPQLALQNNCTKRGIAGRVIGCCSLKFPHVQKFTERLLARPIDRVMGGGPKENKTMRLSLLATGTALLLCTTAAIAQTNAPSASTAAPSANSANNTTGTGDNGASSVAPGRPGSQFVSVDQNEKLSSNLIGLDVYDASNQDIGEIKDLALGPEGRTRAFIVSVGGFLGVGTHYVAMNPSDIKVSYTSSDQKWRATTNATSEQLKSAPEFQYTGRWNASKS